MQVFTTEDIQDTLARLGIPFESGPPALHSLRFKSLRKIEEAGIYYVEGAANDRIRNSLILCADAEGFDPSNCLVKVAHPQIAFYKLMRFYFGDKPNRGVHASAIIDPEARIAADVEIGPYCVIGKAEIRSGARLSSHVVVGDDCVIGAHTVIESHSTIGASGVAWVWDSDGKERIVQPQIGGVVIGAHCFLGSDVSVVRGSVNEDTSIGDGSVIAHGSKLGHGCRIGADNHFANNVSLAGNVTTGERCFFGSAAVVRPMISLAPDTTVGAGAVVVESVREPHLVLMGVPAKSSQAGKTRLSGVPKKIEKDDK